MTLDFEDAEPELLVTLGLGGVKPWDVATGMTAKRTNFREAVAGSRCWSGTS